MIDTIKSKKIYHPIWFVYLFIKFYKYYIYFLSKIFSISLKLKILWSIKINFNDIYLLKLQIFSIYYWIIKWLFYLLLCFFL